MDLVSDLSHCQWSQHNNSCCVFFTDRRCDHRQQPQLSLERRLQINQISMSAIFDFSSLITVLLLCICTTTYLRELRPGIFDAAKEVSVQQCVTVYLCLFSACEDERAIALCGFLALFGLSIRLILCFVAYVNGFDFRASPVKTFPPTISIVSFLTRRIVSHFH